MFSPPCMAPTPQARSRVGPLVCERYPWAMIRSAFWTATAARQSLQLSAPSPAVARSWLMRFCWALTPSPDAAAAGCTGAAHTVSKDASKSASTPARVRAVSLLPTTMQRGLYGRDCDSHRTVIPPFGGRRASATVRLRALAVPADDIGEHIDTTLRVVDRDAAVDRGQFDDDEVGHRQPGDPVQVRRGRLGGVAGIDREVAARRCIRHRHVHDHALGRRQGGN